MAGPKLWGKHLSLKEFDEDDFSVMNIEEFLEENNIKVKSDRNFTLLPLTIPFQNSSRQFASQNSPGPELEESSSLPLTDSEHHGAPGQYEGLCFQY